MDSEQKVLDLEAEKDSLKKKATSVRILAVLLILILLASYFAEFYMEIISIGCITIGVVVFIFVGIPTQKKLHNIGKKIREIGREDEE